VPVEEAGLYTLTYDPPYMMPMLQLTTPNPRQVLLTGGPDGLPQSFLDADFGVADELPPSGPPPVAFSDLPPGSLQVAPWTLLAARVTPVGDPDGGRKGGEDPPPHGDWPLVLHLRAGFSGCRPEHPFDLFVSGDVHPGPDDMPTALLVAVNTLDEDCDAWFQHGYGFDLQPLRERFLELNGGPGELMLEVWNPDGEPLQLPVRVE